MEGEKAEKRQEVQEGGGKQSANCPRRLLLLLFV